MLNKKRIAIFVGFLCCLFFMTTFAGGTAQNTVIATRLVTFIDGYNNRTISEQTIEVGTDAEVPSDPRHEGLVFAGWYRYEDQDVRVTDFTNILEDTRVIAKYAGDINGNGIADDDETRYTVTFRDSFDGSILRTEEVLPGMNATAPVVPAHEGRTFVGWNGNYTNVNGNVTVETVYTVDAVAGEENPEDPVDVVVEDTYYTVTFIDGENDEVIVETRVREGLTAQTPNIPEHENRVFDYWDGDYSNVTGDRTIIAVYTDDLNGDGIRDYLEIHYTVEFVILPYLNGTHGKFEEGATLKYENIVAGLTFDRIGVVVPNTIPENVHYSASWKKVDSDSIVDWDITENVIVNTNLTFAVMFVPDVDANTDGVADSDQTYSLTINYVSRGTNGTYVLSEPEVKSVVVGTEVNLAKEFTGYKADATQNLKITMPEEDTEVTVYYRVVGKDENGNGKNDAEETYNLTINYVSRGTNGTYVLSEPEVKSVVAGTEVNLAKEFTGYKADATQNLKITMPEEDTEVTVYYRVVEKDENGNGKNDTEETYKLTVNYVSEGEKETYTLDTVEKDVLVGTEVTVEKDFEGYTVKADQPKTVTMPEENTTVAIYYTVDGKDENGNGKNDTEETYKLTVNYVSEGEKETYTLDTVEKDVLVGSKVTVEKDFEGYTVKASQPKTIVMPSEETVVTIYYTVDGKDENGNGKNDSEETYKLTVNYVSEGEKETYTLDTVEKDVLAGSEVTVEKDFEGYTVKASQPKTITMPEKDFEVTVGYTANKDKNGNGQNDNEETFKLTVTYVSEGTKETYTLDTVEKDVLAGTEVTVEKDFEGYTVKADQPKTIVMPSEETEVTISYTVDGKDENGNGKNDSEETYKLTVTYVSEGTKGTHTLEKNETNVLAGEEVNLERAFEGYAINDGQTLLITMPKEDQNITIYYHVVGKDENENGKNDEDETYKLTINRISKGSKSNTTLEIETISALVGTTVDLTKNIEGYVLEDNQELSVTMPEKNIEVIVYYTVDGKDENGNGKNDTEETYTLTIRYVNSKGVEIANSTTQSVVAGTDVIITPVSVTNYTPVEASKTVTMPESNEIVTIEYTADIVGIHVTDNGNLLQFKVGSDKSKIKEKISVYLVDADGEIKEEVFDYTTNFDPNKSANTEYKLKVEYNYNGKTFVNESLIYILVTGEASENGFDLVNTNSESYKKYNGNGLLPGWSGNWETVTPGYEFLELTQNYFGSVEMISAIANYDNVTSVNLTVSSRVRYSWKGIFSGNYYSSVFIVSREDKQPIFDENAALETIVLTYKKDGIIYRMTFRYDETEFVVESTERVN